MNKEDLLEYKKKLSELSEKERKQRDLYLKNLSTGKLQGPAVGYPSIDKSWLKYYSDSAIQTDIPNIKAFDYIYMKNKDHLNDIAIEFTGEQITYKEFFQKIEIVAKSLMKIGVTKGDVVTLAMATSPETAYLFYALNRLGATVNAVDPRYTYEEFETKIKETNSKYFFGINMSTSKLIGHENELGLNSIVEISPLESSRKKILKLLLKLKDKKTTYLKWKDFLKKGQDVNNVLDCEYDEDLPVIVVYTGGTTGIPKGVLLTNKNLMTMSLNNEISIDYNYNRGETMLNFLPPFSAYSIVNALHDPLSWGFKTIMIPLFKPTDFPKLMAKYKPNHVLSGPILWEYLMNSKKYSNIDLSFLKSPVSGGDSMNEQFELKLNDYLKKQGCKYKIQQGYGMTEVSAAATYSTEKSYSKGSVGVPYFKNVVSAFNPLTNEELLVNEEGEIRISTPTMMKGYNNNKTATDEIIKTDSDGKRWISTGDIGYVNSNGSVYIKGRIKRLIVRSGNKIFPINIENVMMQLKEIENCAVVSMPDSKEKNVPVAYIVGNDEIDINNEELVLKIKELIKMNMPEYNVPVKFIFKSELPLTGMAKVDFKTLEQESLSYINSDEIVNFEKKR